MTIHSYLFEAKSIQSYILDSGKLRDLVGASELVDALCGKPLTDALAACGLIQCELPSRGDFDESTIGERIAFSRRAGGAFYAFSGSAKSVARLAAFWPLVVQQYAPGLDFDHGRGKGKDALAAFEDGSPSLRRAHSRVLIEFPQAGPLTHRSQRTGRPAIQLSRTPDRGWEPLDTRTVRQRQGVALHGLATKLGPLGSGLLAEHWPRNLDAREADERQLSGAFPFEGDDRSIAVVHADGNRLGQLLMDLEQHIRQDERRRGAYLSAFSQASVGIQSATERAAQRAVELQLLPHRNQTTGMLPARAVLLGGDDLTIIVRADLALPFTRTFLAAFEDETAQPMGELRARGMTRVPERLTACAGIAYIKASQPFYLGAHLAEGITSAAKRQAKRLGQEIPPSTLAWHRVTTAMIDNYAQALKQELTIGPADARYRNTLGAYAITADREDAGRGADYLPNLDDLLALQRLLNQPEMARGPTRQLLTLLGQSPEQARTHYKRWSALMREPTNGKADVMKEYERLLTRLIGSASESLPYRSAQEDETDAHHVGPLGDLHALIAVKNRIDPGLDPRIGTLLEDQS